MRRIIQDEAGKNVCNFRPEVQALVDAYADSNAEPERYVKLRLSFEGEEFRDEITVPLSQLENYDWLGKDVRCQLNPEMSPSKAKRYIACEVRKVLSSMTPRKQYRLKRLGWHMIEGIPVFNTGGGLICPPSFEGKEFDVELESTSLSMDIDESLSEAEAIAGMLELVSLCPNAGRIILAKCLLYIMRAAYADAWKSPCCCVFLHGKTGTKKTTLSAFLTQMYNRDKGIASLPRLNASISSAVAIIGEKSDCVVVLDDLFPSNSREIRRKQEETLLEITRIIADAIEPARKRGNKVTKAQPTCGVLFTGEYLVGTGSTAVRLLPVEMTAPDGERLKEFQAQPLMVSTFYHGFITWFVSNYFDVRESLKEWDHAYNGQHFAVHDRLKETHFFLNTAYAMLLQYCLDKGVLSEQDAEVLHRSFRKLLTNLVRAQQERVEQGEVSEDERIDFLARIRAMFHSGEIALAANPELFKDRNSRYDGVIHNGELCLRGDTLRRIFPGIPPEDVARGLLSKGILRRCSKDLQIQINSTGGKRFYAIPLDKLQ